MCDGEGFWFSRVRVVLWKEDKIGREVVFKFFSLLG